MNAIVRNIPNSITCLNVLCGTAAIICASRGGEDMWCGLDSIEWSYIFVALAAVADFFDGFAARMLHAYSNLGKELDSLCDLVSFGVAPAVILFRTLSGVDAPEWICWCSLLIPVCGALRLARFNIDDRQTASFIGLPIPANAIFWIGFTALYRAQGLSGEWFALTATLVVSWLMISPVRLFSLKFKTWGWRGNQARYILIASAFAFLILCGLPGLMWLIVFYVCLSLAAPKISRGEA